MVLTLRVKRPSAGGSSRELTVHQVLRLRKGLIADIRGYSTRGEEESPTVGGLGDVPGITARHVIPILNVSSLARSFDWFGKLGWLFKKRNGTGATQRPRLASGLSDPVIARFFSLSTDRVVAGTTTELAMRESG